MFSNISIVWLNGSLRQTDSYPNSRDLKKVVPLLLYCLIGPIIYRSCHLQCQFKGDKHTVQHLNFTEWPNYGVVENLSQLLSFIKTVANTHQSGAPMAVHCSGGVGRSGTFSTIFTFYNVIQEALAGEENKILDDLIDVEGALYLLPLVKHLREIRHPWMVEGEEQYTLAYKTCNYVLTELINGAS